VVARRHAARDLDVDHLVLRAAVLGQAMDQPAATLQPAVTACGLAMRTLARLRCSRCHVLVEAEQPLPVDRHHLVDAVAEDEAAVEHRYPGIAQAAVLAVQVARGVRQRSKGGCHRGSGKGPIFGRRRHCKAGAPRSARRCNPAPRPSGAAAPQPQRRAATAGIIESRAGSSANRVRPANFGDHHIKVRRGKRGSSSP
jgi:hypothetical protein